tara:strand:+ start:355 stop:867 length:513 start_codon:yes stop_codon:yes gene_type:complete
MNIFFLDKFPVKSAEYLCDKHVPKMLLESAQMLSTAVRRYLLYDDKLPLLYDDELPYIYKSAYPNHPMTKWVSISKNNFNWALENAIHIHEEYRFRFNKNHKSYKVIKNIIDFKLDAHIPDGNFTEPPQCMPDEYKDKNYVVAYRRYYVGEKKYFAKWEKGRSQPEWWVN